MAQCFSRTRILLLLVAACGCNLSAAQNQRQLDSLYAILPSVEDTARVMVLGKIGRLEFQRDVSKGFPILEDALRNAKILKFKRGLYHCYRVLSSAHLIAYNDYYRASAYLDSAEAHASAPDQMSGLALSRAMIHSRTGEFEISHSLLLKALEWGPGDEHAYILIYNNIGYNLTNLGRYREAVQFYKRSVDIAEMHFDPSAVGAALSNLASPYLFLREYDSAFQVLNRLYIVEVEHGNPLDNSTLLSGLAKVYLEKGQFDTAYYFMHTGLKAANAAHLPYAISMSMSNLGKYHLTNRPDSALFYGRKLLGEINNATLLTLEDANFIMAEAHARLKYFDSAYFYLRQYNTYHDSVFQENQTRQIAEMEAAYQLREKQQAIDRLRSETENEILKRNMFAAAFVLVFVIAVLVVLILRARIRAKKKELAAKNWQLENFTRSMVEKSELVEEMRSQIDHLKSEFREPRDRIENLSEILNSSILTDEDWEKFKALFEQVHHSFFAELKLKHPGLTQAEIRLAALVKLNISTKEMANMLGISPDSANKARYRLRKKLELNPEQDLKSFIENVSEPEMKA